MLKITKKYIHTQQELNKVKNELNKTGFIFSDSYNMTFEYTNPSTKEITLIILTDFYKNTQ